MRLAKLNTFLAMKVILYSGCSLFIWRNNEVEKIDPDDVDVRFENKRPIYSLKSDPETDWMIVQAFNKKKAVAKLLTMLRQRNGH